MADKINEILSSDIASTIEELLFKQDDLSATEKVNLSLVCKDKWNMFTNETRARICNIYEEVKNTRNISVNDAMFVEKQIDFITEEEVDFYDGQGGEDSEEYKNFCYKLTVDFAYNKLYAIYLAFETGNRIQEGEKYVLSNDPEFYQANAVEIHSKLERHDIGCVFPNVQDLHGYMLFVKNLTFKQKLCAGL
jgi:hypothetical protein